MKKVFLKTYGCQMNVYDSEIMAGLLLVKGYEIAEDMNEADIILLNTCSIRKKAEDKVYSQLGVLRKLKEKNNGWDGYIFCSGCFKKISKREMVKINKRLWCLSCSKKYESCL